MSLCEQYNNEAIYFCASMIIHYIVYDEVIMKKILIVLFLLCIALPVFAANWVQYDEKGWFDENSFKFDGKIASAWFKELNNGNIKPFNNKKVWYTLSLFQADCENKQYNLKTLIIYGLDDEALDSYSRNIPKWQDVVPDTRGEYKYMIMCGGR